MIDLLIICLSEVGPHPFTALSCFTHMSVRMAGVKHR